MGQKLVRCRQNAFWPSFSTPETIFCYLYIGREVDFQALENVFALYFSTAHCIGIPKWVRNWFAVVRMRFGLAFFFTPQTIFLLIYIGREVDFQALESVFALYFSTAHCIGVPKWVRN